MAGRKVCLPSSRPSIICGRRPKVRLKVAEESEDGGPRLAVWSLRGRTMLAIQVVVTTEAAESVTLGAVPICRARARRAATALRSCIITVRSSR